MELKNNHKYIITLINYNKSIKSVQLSAYSFYFKNGFLFFYNYIDGFNVIIRVFNKKIVQSIEVIMEN